MNKQQIQEQLSSIRGYHSESEKKEILRKYANSLGYTEDITGDACQGDHIIFARATFTGSHKKPRYNGDEIITGIILNDSYGSRKQQHTFTIQVRGQGKLLIKGRNLYSIGTFAKPRDKDTRQHSLDDKHDRGNHARDLKQRIIAAKQSETW